MTERDRAAVDVDFAFRNAKFTKRWQNLRGETVGILSDVAPTILETMHIPKPADMTGEAHGEIEAHHVERAMRNVDDSGDAEDQRQSSADQEQTGGSSKSVQRLEQKSFKAHLTRRRAEVRPMLNLSVVMPREGGATSNRCPRQTCPLWFQ